MLSQQMSLIILLQPTKQSHEAIYKPMKQPEGITTLLNKATELLPEGIDSLREGVANNLQGIVEQKVKEAGFVSRKEFEELLLQLDSVEKQCAALESTLNELKQRN